ncbi:P-loop containing nucleoside triphosphate hydrolase protein [Suillus clintonianus]|uniref:P-loop containing nucleoside triphosphate hydrolase protein n=1 Tax=Suillus clintonianus TaxID=1904413 RepID=UPI001B86E37A|nr:P-loop containing nucleoside triphosphate hydrolase protein [Suillus clintonianus]KAG2157121.1 P-loop containing nucleoside triphosphate hydrolase protein [Suillus clintonianus]
MATRRPPISRSRVPTINTKPQSSISKSKSALSTITSPTTEEHPEHALAISSSLKGSRSQGQDSSETHIHVAIRCRRRSDREIQENSPIIVSSNGAKSQEVTIETSAPVSSLGVITLAPTRTYPFDLVFGPEADQAMIYHDVVSPMLDEVLMGYNCTLFAYGQTGTGKTYTMQGDLTPTPMGNPSAQAGMVPRVLFRLFHQLETSATDYSVKISFVELYNEELRDLLANELSAPAGSAQPMGKGGPGDNQVGLKIFDDASKKGVFIQGLEEIPVKDATDALALLTKGSHRRQIAATKFNDHSSRSHSVFSITIHIKETSTMGDDLLKVGKFNLVDLAGSENIGRSGAENKRAREAGMINQSLLTLGRVINALVERSAHVPYRESKLTRLLQDSLGGRTKTYIIATISPARSNMEETLSTLDYAIRAKSIRNKPEINQRMTRNSLLKEYVAEIERLKADVLAAREKNGIFFSEETWNQLTTEQELKQTEMEEAKKQVEIVESHLRSVREEFEQSIALLMKTDGELKQTKEKLKETEGELQVTEGHLKVAKGALEEEVLVRQAYQVNEEKLDGVALGLKQVAAETIDDIGALFEKLQRKNKTFTSNIKAVSSHGRSISSEVQSLSTKIDDFMKTAGHTTQTLRAEAKQFQTKEFDILTSHSERIDQQLQRIQDSLRIINAKDDASAEAVAAMQNAVKESQETMKSSFSCWSDSLRTTTQTMCKEVYATNQSNFASLENSLKAMGTLLDSFSAQAIDFAKAEGESALQAKSLVDVMSRAENAAFQEQNALLIQIAEAQKVKSAKANDVLVQRISDLLGEFVASRDRELREACGAVVNANVKHQEEFSDFGQRHEQLMNEVATRSSEANTSFERTATEGKRTRDGALKTVGSVQVAIKDVLLATHNSITTATTTYTGELQRHSQTLQTSFGAGLDRHDRAKRARIETTNGFATEVQTELRHLQRGIASSSRNVEGFSGRVVSESTSLSDTIEKHGNNTTSRLASLHQTARSLLDQGTREDVPTGMTPRKRGWEYVDEWELTQSRDVILQSRRQGEPMRHASEPPPSQHPQSPVETLSEQMEVDALIDECSDEPQIPVPPSPLTSSTATLTEIPIAPPVVVPRVLKKPATLKSGLPTMGTLVDRPPNTMRNGSRRIR